MVQRRVIDLRRRYLGLLVATEPSFARKTAVGQARRLPEIQHQAPRHFLIEGLIEGHVEVSFQPRPEQDEAQITVDRLLPDPRRARRPQEILEQRLALSDRPSREELSMCVQTRSVVEQVDERGARTSPGPRRRQRGGEVQTSGCDLQRNQSRGRQHLGQRSEIVDGVTSCGCAASDPRPFMRRECAVRFVVEGGSRLPHQRDRARVNPGLRRLLEAFEELLTRIVPAHQLQLACQPGLALHSATMSQAPESSIARARQGLIVALDVPDAASALAMADKLAGHVGMLKIGLELFVAEGPEVVRQVKRAHPQLGIFLDLKLHDIPNTMQGAIRSARQLGADLITVHAGSGVEHLRACVEAAGPDMGVLAVTVLTSQDAQACKEAGHTRPPEEIVEMRAVCAREAGCAGIVCSGQELSRVKAVIPDLYRVVPGIRPAGAAVGDQKRVMTPAKAMTDGATHLVVGRPIRSAEDPAAAADAIVTEMSSVL